MLTGINVDRMNEIVWTDDLVWSLWSDAVDGDCHLYPVDRLRICDTMCQKGGNKPRTVMLCSTMSNSLGPPGLQLTRLFYPWNFFFFFGRNTGVGCHFLLHRVFLIQGSNPCVLHLLHCQADSLPLSYLGNPRRVVLHALKWNSRVFVIRSTICQVVYFHSKQL